MSDSSEARETELHVPAGNVRETQGSDGATSRAPDDEASLPKRVGPFTIERELGRGGMGVVYVATSAELGRRVALKVLREGPFADAEVRERFKIEAAATARLRHPNIVGIHRVGEEEGPPTWSWT